jgi:hypothetical protein
MRASIDRSLRLRSLVAESLVLTLILLQVARLPLDQSQSGGIKHSFEQHRTQVPLP